MPERKETIRQHSKELLRERYHANLLRLHESYLTDGKSYILELQAICERLFKKASQYQSAGKVGEIAYLCIHPLHSGCITGSYEVQISLYDQDYYLCEIEMTEYWKPYFLYRYLDEDIAYLSNVIKKKMVRLMDYEIKEYRGEYAANYTLLLLNFCMENIQTIRSAPHFKEMRISGDFKILFGEYMMPGMQMDPKSEEGSR